MFDSLNMVWFLSVIVMGILEEGDSMREYYKKVDKSFFNYGIAVPKEYVKDFVFDEPLEPGKSRNIDVYWNNRIFKVRMQHINRKNSTSAYHLRWDNNYDLLSELKREFIQSYFAIESQNYQAKSEKKYYITNLLGGNQEVIIFRPKSVTEIELETFIKIETPYDNLFKRIVDENVFGWLSNIESSKLITKSTKWYDINEVYKHEEANFVVYYLMDEKNKQIYIGSAKRLGDRVKIGRPEIPEWNKFRYEIVHPKYHACLREIEYHSIMNFARFFKSNGSLSNLNISEYKLVNKDYKYNQA